MLSKDIERLEREAVQRQDADWQRQLQKVIGGKAKFQSAVSFARTGHKK